MRSRQQRAHLVADFPEPTRGPGQDDGDHGEVLAGRIQLRQIAEGRDVASQPQLLDADLSQTLLKQVEPRARMEGVRVFKHCFMQLLRYPNHKRG